MPTLDTHVNKLEGSIASWLQTHTMILKRAGITSARLDCIIMLEQALQKDRAWLAGHDESALTAEQIQKLNTFVTQRASRVPLAYIVGSKEFYGNNFLVSSEVLIPRPESEDMINLAVAFASSRALNTIVDMGTGSGCLAITLKKLLPALHVTGVDVSTAALKVAQKNARLQGVTVQWKQRDLMKDGLPRIAQTRPYVITANLPYVPTHLITSPEITKEPAIALFSGSDGLNHYRSLWDHIATSSHKPRAVITEGLTSQHKALKELAKQSNYQLLKTKGLAQLFVA